MKVNNKMAMGIAIVAGVLLLISGLSGVATWEKVEEFVIDNIADNDAIKIVFVVLIFIASLGGIAVIIGGLLIGGNSVGSGKLLIALGAGLGLIGLIVAIAIAYSTDSLTIGEYFSIGAIGLILSIVARSIAKQDN
jgi:hypothetical protein